MRWYGHWPNDLGELGITVNAIALGLEPHRPVAEVAELVAFLVGKDGRAVNGQVIRARGARDEVVSAGR